MRLHPRARMKINVPWLERKIKGKGRNPNPNHNLVKGTRINTCLKLSAFIVMNLGTMLRSVHTRRQVRRPQEEHRVKLWFHNLRVILMSLHACPIHWCESCGTWTTVPHSIWQGIKILSMIWRGKISRCTLRWDIMEDITWLGLVQSHFRRSHSPLSDSRMWCLFRV